MLFLAGGFFYGVDIYSLARITFWKYVQSEVYVINERYIICVVLLPCIKIQYCNYLTAMFLLTFFHMIRFEKVFGGVMIYWPYFARWLIRADAG